MNSCCTLKVHFTYFQNISFEKYLMHHFFICNMSIAWVENAFDFSFRIDPLKNRERNKKTVKGKHLFWISLMRSWKMLQEIDTPLKLYFSRLTFSSRKNLRVGAFSISLFLKPLFLWNNTSWWKNLQKILGNYLGIISHERFDFFFTVVKYEKIHTAFNIRKKEEH